jgi:hypothetical protein
MRNLRKDSFEKGYSVAFPDQRDPPLKNSPAIQAKSFRRELPVVR